MMVEPGMDVLLTKVDSKYTLVSVSSKRARKIMAKDDGSLENPVTVALNEIAEGKVEWTREEKTEDTPEEELDV
ncbi:MAG: DNA-directed RNA polymerase subunit omega [Clostridia bacterium]